MLCAYVCVHVSRCLTGVPASPMFCSYALSGHSNRRWRTWKSAVQFTVCIVWEALVVKGVVVCGCPDRLPTSRTLTRIRIRIQIGGIRRSRPTLWPSPRTRRKRGACNNCPNHPLRRPLRNPCTRPGSSVGQSVT